MELKDYLDEILKDRITAPSLREALRPFNPLTPTELRWEDIINRPGLETAQQFSGLPKNILEYTHLLSPDLFERALQTGSYPYPSPDTSEMLGAVPNEFQLRTGMLSPTLRNAMLINLRGDIPETLRHEFRHQEMFPVTEPRNYGYINVPGLTEWLYGYPEEGRGEELGAAAWSGEFSDYLSKEIKRMTPQKMRGVMPEELRRKALRDIGAIFP